jgi:hypothetical protein
LTDLPIAPREGAEPWERWAAIDAAALFVVFDEPPLIRRTMPDGIDPDELPFPVCPCPLGRDGQLCAQRHQQQPAHHHCVGYR